MIANAITSARLVLVAPLWLLIVRADDRSRWFALIVFMMAGISDVVDGRLARARGETSSLGAMLDLIADRLLTLSVVSGLLTAGLLSGLGAVAAIVLVLRDLVVASFGEALGERLKISVAGLERAKIAFQFLAFALLIAPPVPVFGPADQHQLGRVMLIIAALLALVTLIEYSTRAAQVLRERGS
jgi:cardiolipin synthase